ncbi:TMV resistance protein N-like [Solanum stenotomum]|uniref:TMV resistance protein N-like n=1 Tax=Solanum stenotomum TaxID=172797 RepID=UPI0020D0E69F|nr:TMV resistance protein N-like [Solanum stenotomum]
MASSSSSFVSNSQYSLRWKYDVFLSFRGKDTRKTFTSHLYQGLKNKGILTFQDDKRLEHGDSISEELLKAIKESQVALIVFSKNYATSRWCLNELVKIMECYKDENGKTVIPVFYDVDPSHVRYQSDSFAESFAKYELQFKDDVEGMQKVKRWRTALCEAADLKGHDIRQGVESENIQLIVNQVSSKLCKTSVSYLRDVVGINIHLEEVKSQLKLEINDVRIVGIWGMGGIGKTTIARAIFDTLSYQFEASCFIEDIKENKCGMHSLQNILLSELLREKDNYVNNKEDGKHMIARRLPFKKVLVVLDDIDHRDHLDYLAGNPSWFGDGSRIIATTRDKHLIGKNDVVYEVSTLVDCHAIKLFNQYAFKEEDPDERFEKLSLEVVRHAKGLPLALKVWGSFLHKRDITEWRSAIEEMKNNSNSEIVEKLRISYDRLETIQQDIFLDIACFFRGKVKDHIMQILESCYSGANIGLRVLIDKSLVFISENNTIQMHDLIQEMGKYVVKMQKYSGEASRLWDDEDFEEVMVNDTGTKAMEAIWLQYIQKLSFSEKAMKNMRRLRILYIRDFHTHVDSIEYLPNSLRWLAFYHYPWESLPENFEPKRLVHLNLRFSLALRHLWTGTKHLPSLRMLDLSYSTNLMRTPDFTGMPNLEYLNLSHCSNLEEIHHSLGCSRKLNLLYLCSCTLLKRFPCVSGESLEYLYLHSCYNLETFPEILGRMKPELKIKMKRSGIRELPSSIQYLTHITKLNLKFMKKLVSLPNSICMMKSLVEINVSYCLKLESLPEEIGDLLNLEKLDATYTLISRPPSSIVRLNKLRFLSFAKQSSEVGLKDGVFFVFPRVNEGLHSLEDLHLGYCNLIDGGLPEDIGSLSSLKKLYLTGNSFEHLPRSIAQLGDLRLLHLSDCPNLKEFPQVNNGLRSLEVLDLSCCNLIDGGLPQDIGSLSSLKNLHLDGNNFEHLPRSIAQLGGLQYLNVSNCMRLKELPDFMLMPDLYFLHLIDCTSLEEVHHSLGFFEKLTNLFLTNCKRLKRFPGICIDSLECIWTWGCSSLESYPKIIGSMKVESEIHMLDSVMCDLNSNSSFPRSLSQRIVSLKHDISASDSLSLIRVFTIDHPEKKIPSWFHHQGMDASVVSVNLPENWYVPDNFLGFAVCYSSELINITAHLIPLCDDGLSWMTLKLNLSRGSKRDVAYSDYSECETESSDHSECDAEPTLHYFLVPFSSLWNTSNANGKTPNDYGLITLCFSGELKKSGCRLLYKDEPELVETLLQMRENNDEPTERYIGIRSSRYNNSEHHDSVTNEASCNDVSQI